MAAARSPRPDRDRSPQPGWRSLLLGVAVAAALLIGALAHQRSPITSRSERQRDDAATRAAATQPRRAAPSTRVVARRVARLRGLRFDHFPRQRSVTAAQTRREGLADLRRSYPDRRRRADEQVLTGFGLVPAGTDLRKVAASIYGEEVAGYYDTRRKRLSVVRDSGLGPVEQEITLAHELDHALDDQRFGLREPSSGEDDRSAALTALIEGTATSLMDEYALRYIKAGDLLASSGGEALGGQDVTTSLPPYLERQLVFPYSAGARFVDALRRRAGGGWQLVDTALNRVPPTTTEQIISPRAYLGGERADPVTTGAATTLGPRWRRAAAGTLGQFDTTEIARVADPDAAAANAAGSGWGGGRYELFAPRAPGAAKPRCAAPCRQDRVLVAAWSWDRRSDARQMDALGAAYAARLGGRSAGRRAWRVGRGALATAIAGRRTAFAFAPTPALARRLARRAVTA